MKKDLLDRLIEDRLMLQDAKKENINADENKIRSRVDQIRKRYSSETEFQEALKLQGLTLADIENKLREQSLIFTIVDIKIRGKIVVKPQEVTNFYNEHMQDFSESEQKAVQSLAIPDHALVQKISDDLKILPQDFLKVAGVYSLEVKNLGAIKKGELREDIDRAISNLGVNESSNPVNIDGTYYIFNIKEIIPPRQIRLSESSETIYNLIFEKKMEKDLAHWLDELKSKSYIKIQKY
jgi:parvulin-like peptidyl-prolyl isomerase